MPDAIVGEEQISRILASAAEEVLETMFFTGVMGPAETGTGEGLAALVRFRGAPSGVCGVWLDPAQAQELAGSFLGEETGELTPAKTEQVICEFANMICGSVVSRLEAEERIELDSPRLVSDEEFRGQTADGGVAAWFEMESGTLGLMLKMGGQS